jgi:hypothetical protein
VGMREDKEDQNIEKVNSNNMVGGVVGNLEK